MRDFTVEFMHWVCSNYETPYVVEDEVFWDLKDKPWKEPFSTSELYDIFIDQKNNYAITKTKVQRKAI
jgi:hypothetical protein